MATAWYTPSGSAPDATAGDLVIAPFGDGYRIGEVGEGGSGPEWLGDLAAEALPESARLGDEVHHIDDEAALRAVRAVAAAERNRGG